MKIKPNRMTVYIIPGLVCGVLAIVFDDDFGLSVGLLGGMMAFSICAFVEIVCSLES